MIPDIFKAFDAGEITVEIVEILLDEAYGPEDSEEKTERRERVIQGGQIIKFQLMALNNRAREATQHEAMVEQELVPEELLRDVPEPVYEHPRPDMALEIKRRVGVIAGVRLWGKSQVRINERGTEGIKIRCPFDSHPDHNPSAWVNTEKNTWYCGKCMIGGDVIDFYAARRYGLAPLDFHKSTEFGNVVKEMGEELGIRVQQDTSGDWFVEDDANPLPSAAPDPAPEEEPVAERPIPDEQPEIEYEVWVDPDPVVPSSPEADEPITITEDEMLRGAVRDSVVTEELEIKEHTEAPTFNWRTLDIPENTFLHSWLTTNEQEFDWIPSEYFLMLGIQAIGLACGHSLTSITYGAPLSGSTLLCLIGQSGLGKSMAVGRLREMLQTVIGPKWDKQSGTGVKLLSSPASAEAILLNVYHEIEDPQDATVKIEVGITVWLFEDELSTFITRSQRKANAIKPRIQALHDFVKKKDEPEIVLADTSATNGDRFVHDTFFSGCFLTQPDALSSLTDEVDLVSGFLARMIPVFGRSDTDRQLTKKVFIDPNPPYYDLYHQLWARARTKKQLVPFDDATKQYGDAHPSIKWALKATKDTSISSIYSRLIHNTLRFALLLAVNDGSTSVAPTHLKQAIKLSEYLKAGLGKLVGDVIRTREDDCAAKIIKFVEARYEKFDEWPTKDAWTSDRTSYKEFNSAHRKVAMDSLMREGRLVEVILLGKDPKTGKDRRFKVFVLPWKKGWANYSAYHGLPIKWEDMYS